MNQSNNRNDLCIHTEYFGAANRTIEICKHFLSEDLDNTEYNLVFIYNHEGLYFYVYNSLHDLYAMNKDKAIVFESEDMLDEYLKGNDIDVMSASANSTTPIDAIQVQHWSFYTSKEDAHYYPKTHQIEIDDQRLTNGQLYVTVGCLEGNDSEMLSATFEINTLPGTTTSTECIHLHFDGDNLAASFFKQGDKIIVRPEQGVNILPIALNGEIGYEIN